MVEQKAAEVGLCDVNQTVSSTESFDGVSIDHLKTLPAGVKFITEMCIRDRGIGAAAHGAELRDVTAAEPFYIEADSPAILALSLIHI